MKPQSNVIQFPAKPEAPYDDFMSRVDQDAGSVDLNAVLTEGREGFCIKLTPYGFYVEDPSGRVAWQIIKMEGD